jgi:hypothetical protein
VKKLEKQFRMAGMRVKNRRRTAFLKIEIHSGEEKASFCDRSTSACFEFRKKKEKKRKEKKRKEIKKY